MPYGVFMCAVQGVDKGQNTSKTERKVREFCGRIRW